MNAAPSRDDPPPPLCCWCVERRAIILGRYPLCAVCSDMVGRQVKSMAEAKRPVVSRWRLHSREVIERVLRETAGQTPKQVRAALREAYPFGQRRYTPYKIWLAEVRRRVKPVTESK